MARRLPQARAVRLPGAGHLAFVTHPEQVGGEARRFLVEQE